MPIADRVFVSRIRVVLARFVSVLAIWVVLALFHLVGASIFSFAIGNICARPDPLRAVDNRLSSFDWIRGRMHCVYADGAESLISRRDLPNAMVVWTMLMLALAIAGSWLVLRGIRRDRPDSARSKDEAGGSFRSGSGRG